MRLTFLGAAQTVTGSQYLLETDRVCARRLRDVPGESDSAAQAAFEPKVKALGFATKVPRWRETVELA